MLPRGIDAFEPGGLSSQEWLPFNQGHPDSPAGEVQGGLQAAHTAADYKGMAVRTEADRLKGFQTPGFGYRRSHQPDGLLRSLFRQGVMDPANLLPDVGVFV